MSRPVCPTSRPAAFRALAVLGAVAAGAAVAGCGGTDPYAPRASYDTQETTFAIFPLTGAPSGQPTAIDLRNLRAVRVGLTATGAPAFDLAVDRVGSEVRLLPPKLVTAGVSVPATGFQLVSTSFEELTQAPGGTYNADSAFVAPFGRTVVVQATTTVCSASAPIYAKMVVDSVGQDGAIYIRTRVDPNCGFKSLASGLPKS